MRKLGLAALATAGALVWTGAANSAVVTATIVGTVDSETHTGAPFGAAPSYAGDAFTAVFKFDTSLGTPTTSPTSSELAGGYLYGVVADPIVLANLTINGQSEGFVDRFYGDVKYDWAAGTVFLSSEQNGLSGGVYGSLGMTLAGANVPASFNLPFTLENLPAGTSGGYFYYNDYAGNQARGALIPTSLKVTVTGVPEPASWALMLTGFFSLGLALRNRNRRLRRDRGQIAMLDPR